MNTKAILISLLIFNLCTQNSYASCPTGDSSSLEYIRREFNRCEGIQSDFAVSGGLHLISLTTRGIDKLGDELILKVPYIDNKDPSIFVQATEYGYLLDEFTLSPDGSPYSFFRWSTYVLKKAQITVDRLRALASIHESQTVFVPVTFDRPSNKYEFVVFAPRPTRISVIEISFNGRVVHRESRNSSQRGEIIFTWDGRNEPAGRYKLYFVGEVEQFNGASEEIPVEITFEHNPIWLK